MIPTPVRVRARDLLALGSIGLRIRPLRVVLSALGIAIGVAAMLATLGITWSSRAQLDQQLEQLGTNLLRVSAAEGASGAATALPSTTVGMISRIRPVLAVAGTASVDAHVYRTDLVPVGRTSGVPVLATDRELLTTVGATMRMGSWIAGPPEKYPGVVLGSAAAVRLGIDSLAVRLWLAGQWVPVIGILDPVILAPELDQAAVLGTLAARDQLDLDVSLSTVYVRADDEYVLDVAAVLARTARPDQPSAVRVTRPSDVLAARRVTDNVLTSLLLGLGGVALLVGAIGVANTMVVSVLERRSEIGLRRALGASRAHIRAQFIVESMLLAMIGGTGGVALGAGVTAAYARVRGWPVALPVESGLTAVAATVVIGTVAGLYPATRASRVSPTLALAGG